MIWRRCPRSVPKELRDLPWDRAPWAILDLETTGLDPHEDSIISIGVVPVDDGIARTRDAFYTLVRPVVAPRAASIEIHGIRPSDLAGAPAPGEAAARLREVLGSRLLVAHCAWVEAGFLAALEQRTGVVLPTPVVDTAAMCRAAGVAVLDPTREPSLELAARQLGLPVYAPHHALGDALTTGVLFLALAHRAARADRSGRAPTVADLARRCGAR